MQNYFDLGCKPSEDMLRQAILEKKGGVTFHLRMEHSLRVLMGESTIDDVIHDYLFGENGSREFYNVTNLRNYQLHNVNTEKYVIVTYEVKVHRRY